MNWDKFVHDLTPADRTRLVRSLVEAKAYGSFPAEAPDNADVDWILSCIDRAVDALAAARILISAQAEPQPWADPGYRAFRSDHPDTMVRVRPAELAAVREAVRRRAAAPVPLGAAAG